MPPDFSPVQSEIERRNALRVVRHATLWSVFFSLRGGLSRNEWRWAMVVAGAVFSFVVSLLIGNGEADYATPRRSGSSWPLFALCFACLGVVTLLCAKRLVDCQRPVWLALAVPVPGLLMIAALAVAPQHVWPTLTIISAYAALFALPALIACALYETED
jgi:uncharacterized membrane protein YhaH (DUF805 family)